jgi:hypothetical protein
MIDKALKPRRRLKRKKVEAQESGLAERRKKVGLRIQCATGGGARGSGDTVITVLNK